MTFDLDHLDDIVMSILNEKHGSSIEVKHSQSDRGTTSSVRFSDNFIALSKLRIHGFSYLIRKYSSSTWVEVRIFNYNVNNTIVVEVPSKKEFRELIEVFNSDIHDMPKFLTFLKERFPSAEHYKLGRLEYVSEDKIKNVSNKYNPSSDLDTRLNTLEHQMSKLVNILHSRFS
jgi:hypothetical protein